MPRYTTGPIRIAFVTHGHGPQSLLVIPGWVSHLGYDDSTPEIRRYYERLAEGRTVIRYDKRGTGLSDRPTDSNLYEMDQQIQDTLDVLDAAGVRRTAILGWSEGGPIAVRFAAAHPERVSHLILYGTYAKIHRAPGYPHGTDGSRARALVDLVLAEWGVGSRAFADLFIPEADGARLAWFVDYQRAATSPGVAAGFLRATHRIDVRPLLPGLDIPALVLHRREDRVIPFDLGVYLAETLPSARLHPLQGEHHLPYFGDSDAVVAGIQEFLANSQPLPGPIPEPADRSTATSLTTREREVLHLLAQGLTNREMAARLRLSPATVARHLHHIFAKLQVSSRSAATAYAYRNGLT